MLTPTFILERHRQSHDIRPEEVLLLARRNPALVCLNIPFVSEPTRLTCITEGSPREGGYWAGYRPAWRWQEGASQAQARAEGWQQFKAQEG